MFEEKFGGMGSKSIVKFDSETLTINGKEISLEDTEEVYMFEPSFPESGHVYFSKTGSPASSSIHIKQRGFSFNKKQYDKALELIALLDVEIKQGKSLAQEIVKSSASSSPTPVKKKKNTRVCPKCKSADIQFMENKKKGFSVGKAVAGGVLTGGIGTVAGFAGKKGKKDRWHCTSCGNVFELKTK